MFCLPIHTMLVVKFVVGLGEKGFKHYVHCLSSRVRIGDKSEVGRTHESYIVWLRDH